MLTQKYHKGQDLDLSFSIFSFLICFDYTDIDLGNYADDKTQYSYDFENKKVIKLLEKIINKLFDWFSDNFLKANPDKCHLLINNDENVALKIKN